MDETFLPFSSEESTLPENNKSIKINPSFPWIKNSSSNYHQIPSAIRFHNEIISFCKFVYPDQQDIIRREKILDRIQKVTKVLWESSLLKVFGSQLTRILTSTSDIDICILSVPTRDTVTGSTNSEVDCLHLLASKLKETRKFSYVEVISNAKVPIIKTDDLISGISIDICINNDSGLKTGEFIIDSITKYPPLRPLTIVLKVFLAQRNLNDTYTGGLGSFGLTCMVLSFLQLRKQNQSVYEESYSQNLGILLYDFFSLYAGSFNMFHTGISLLECGSYFRKRERPGDWFNFNRANLIAIENPADPELDVGRNSFQFGKIRRCFEYAHQVLTYTLSISDIRSFLSCIIRSDHPSITIPYQRGLSHNNQFPLKTEDSLSCQNRFIEDSIVLFSRGQSISSLLIQVNENRIMNEANEVKHDPIEESELKYEEKSEKKLSNKNRRTNSLQRRLKAETSLTSRVVTTGSRKHENRVISHGDQFNNDYSKNILKKKVRLGE